MKFLSQYYYVVIFSIFFSILSVVLKNKLHQLNNSFLKILNTQNFFYIILISFVIFYIWGYLTRGAYYTDYFHGTTGDNFKFVAHALSNYNYYSPQHIFFPFIPGKIFQFLCYIGFFKYTDPLIMEKAFRFFSLPVRLFSIIGFAGYYLFLRQVNFSKIESLLGTIFLSTTFAYWFWSIESNARGSLLPVMILTIYFSLKAVTTDKKVSFLFSGIFSALCIYMHIASFYFVIGISFLTTLILFYKIKKNRKNFVNLVYYLIPICFFALLYYFLCSKHYETWNFIRLYARIAVPDYMSQKTFGILFLKNLLKTGISTNLSMIIGLVYGKNKTWYELIIITIQLTAVSLVIYKLILINLDKLGMKEKNDLLFVLFCLIIVIIGFAIRETWPEYYMAIIPLSTLTILLTLFNKTILRKKSFSHIVLITLIITQFIINGFASNNVLKYQKVDDVAEYRAIEAIQNIVQYEPVIYFASSNLYPYNFRHMMSYYTKHKRTPYKNIYWENRLPSINDIVHSFGSQKNLSVLINVSDYQDKIKSIPTNITIEKINFNKEFNFFILKS